MYKRQNDDQIGPVIQLALQTPFVGGVTIQPVFGSGRSAGIDPVDRLTHTGVLARLGEQTDGQITWRDLTALPCSHPHCASVGYFLRDDSGQWRSLVSLIGPDRLKDYLDLAPDEFANRFADQDIPARLRASVKDSLLGLLSEQSSVSHPDIGRIWKDICTTCDIGIGTLTTLAASRLPGQAHRLRTMLAERVVRITVKPFMDINTMIEERLTQCCVHVATVNRLPDHLVLQKISVKPAALRVLLDSWIKPAGLRLETEPLALQSVTSSMTVALRVNAVSGASFPDGKSARVQVAVRVKPKEPTP